MVSEDMEPDVRRGFIFGANMLLDAGFCYGLKMLDVKRDPHLLRIHMHENMKWVFTNKILCFGFALDILYLFFKPNYCCIFVLKWFLGPQMCCRQLFFLLTAFGLVAKELFIKRLLTIDIETQMPHWLPNRTSTAPPYWRGNENKRGSCRFSG